MLNDFCGSGASHVPSARFTMRIVCCGPYIASAPPSGRHASAGPGQVSQLCLAPVQVFHQLV